MLHGCAKGLPHTFVQSSLFSVEVPLSVDFLPAVTDRLRNLTKVPWETSLQVDLSGLKFFLLAGIRHKPAYEQGVEFMTFLDFCRQNIQSYPLQVFYVKIFWVYCEQLTTEIVQSWVTTMKM